jgi:hypothetical protein
MSKKLIAVASATALALSALVGIAPAVASGPNAAFANGAAGTSAEAPNEITVPHANTIASGTNARGLDLSGLATGDVVTLEITGKGRIIENAIASANKSIDVSKLGVQSWTWTADAATKSVYVFTTGTAVETISFKATRTGGSFSKTLYLQGLAGPAFNVTALTGIPTTLGKTAKASFSFKLTDAFGNPVEDDDQSGVSLAVTSSTGAAVAFKTGGSISGSYGYDTAAKTYNAEITSSTTTPFIITAAITETSMTNLPWADPVFAARGVVNNPGASDQVTSLTTQLAEANAKLAKRVTKKRFNTLARKWNAAFPSQKVKLKK